MKYISSFELLGKKLYEQLKELSSLGTIEVVSPQQDGTVLLKTEQGAFLFKNRGRRTEEGIRLEGDDGRYGIIK